MRCNRSIVCFAHLTIGRALGILEAIGERDELNAEVGALALNLNEWRAIVIVDRELGAIDLRDCAARAPIPNPLGGGEFYPVSENMRK